MSGQLSLNSALTGNSGSPLSSLKHCCVVEYISPPAPVGSQHYEQKHPTIAVESIDHAAVRLISRSEAERLSIRTASRCLLLQRVRLFTRLSTPQEQLCPASSTQPPANHFCFVSSEGDLTVEVRYCRLSHYSLVFIIIITIITI